MVFVNVCVVGICGAVALDNNRLQEQKPFSMKREAIYTPVMYIHLIVQLVYQTGCLVMLCFVHNVSLQHNTFLFLSFMFMQLFNLLNCRAINNGTSFVTALHLLTISFFLLQKFISCGDWQRTGLLWFVRRHCLQLPLQGYYCLECTRTCPGNNGWLVLVLAFPQ